MLPQVLMFVASLGRRSAYGGVVHDVERSPTTPRALEPLYLWILARSVVLALVTTLLCLLVGVSRRLLARACARPPAGATRSSSS